MRYILSALILVGLCFSAEALGQKKELRKAKAAFFDEDWYHCTVYYQQAEEKGAELKLDDTKRLARAYFELNQKMKSYELYNGVESDLSGEDIYYYARSLHCIGAYDDAIVWYDRAKKSGSVSGKVMQINDMIEACKWANNNQNNIPGIRVNPENAFLEVTQSFGVQRYKDKVVYSYASSNSDKLDKNGNPFLNLYTLEFRDGKVQEGGSPQLFSKNLQSEYHVGAIAFTSDQKHIFLTKTVYVNKEPRVKIYVADFDGTDWVNERPVEFDSDEYDFAHPAVSPDDKYLYFVSNMPDHTKVYGKDVKNYGGKDIYRAEFAGDVNHFKKVENLGPEVNTYGDEVYPVINPDGKLYFSSDTRCGFGGLDLFCSEYINGKWQNTLNMLKPFNTSGDDFYYLRYAADAPEGLLSAFDPTRDEQRDMFFSVTKLKEDNTKVQEVVPVFGADGIILPTEPSPVAKANEDTAPEVESLDWNVTIYSTYNNEIVPGAKVALSDEATDKEIASALSGADGNAAVPVKLQYLADGREVIIVVSKDGFNEKTIQATEDELVEISKEGIKLTPIFNDAVLDDISGMVIPYSNDLDDAAKAILDKLASYLLQSPGVTVKLNAHTEAKGNRYGNLQISQQMADKAKQYLVSKGVNENQLIPRGYGERYLLNRCHRGIYCDAAQHKANRRIEVVVWNVAK
ncbi:MAG: OmpA family protein [Marinilabiliaceae bacterium]